MSWPQLKLTKKTLAIQLHGTLLTQVNAGPLAVAQTFLGPEMRESFPPDLTDRMEKVFVAFVQHLAEALGRQKPLIDTHEIPIQMELERSYFDFKAEVSKLTNAPLDSFTETFSPPDPVLFLTSQPKALPPDSPLTTVKKQPKKSATSISRTSTKEKKEKDDKRESKKKSKTVSQETRTKKQVKSSVGTKSPRPPKQ